MNSSQEASSTKNYNQSEKKDQDIVNISKGKNFTQNCVILRILEEYRSSFFVSKLKGKMKNSVEKELSFEGSKLLKYTPQVIRKIDNIYKKGSYSNFKKK